MISLFLTFYNILCPIYLTATADLESVLNSFNDYDPLASFAASAEAKATTPVAETNDL